jgi:hypothetical protein
LTFRTQLRHRPLHAGDPFFFAKRSEIGSPGQSRAMTK